MSAVLLIDKKKVIQSFSLAANTYDGLAILQQTVGLKLLQQFPKQRNYEQVVDVGCGTGFLTQQLFSSSSTNTLVAVDIAISMIQRARIKIGKGVQYICADAEAIPLIEYSTDIVVSNLALQWCQNLLTVFNGFKRLLKKEGQLLFSTFGPETLRELKQAWSEVDDYQHVNDFYSAGDLVVFLKQAGFEEIKIETKYYHSRYLTVIELMRELKGIGAHNVLSNRNRKTTSKTNMQAMISAYEKNRVDAMIPATYEIFFVTAKKAQC